MTPVVAMVLKSGGDFAPVHVERLLAQLRGVGGWEGHVVCLTDFEDVWSPAVIDLLDIELRPLRQGWPGWWSKLELCAPEHQHLGDILYFDLDTTIVGPIAELAAINHLTLLADFERHSISASGVMYLPAPPRWQAWELLHAGAGPELVMRSFHRKGDQAFFGWAWHGEDYHWQAELPDRIVSYKKHVQPNGGIIPEKARVVCYHGQPRPWEVE